MAMLNNQRVKSIRSSSEALLLQLLDEADVGWTRAQPAAGSPCQGKEAHGRTGGADGMDGWRFLF